MLREKWTSKDEDITIDLTEFFLSGGNMCLACMVEKYWKISEQDKDFSYYAHKQRRILGKVVRKIRHLNSSEIEELMPELRNIPVLWVMAVDICEDHSTYRTYKILTTPADHEIISNLTAQRIEGIMISQENRVNMAVKLFPTIFKDRIAYIKGNVPYLLRSNQNEQSNS